MTSPTQHRAFPADGFRARWARSGGECASDPAPIEELDLTWENEAWTARGRVGLERVEYVIRLSPLWHVRQFLLFRDLDEPDLWLGTDGHGRWGEVNGAHRTELDGALDVALACTPFTHSLPIRRLPLEISDRADLAVLDVDVDTLAVTPRGVSYTRLASRHWQVGSSGAQHEFDVDEYGLVVDLDPFHRLD